jgi:hypothetical protein
MHEATHRPSPRDECPIQHCHAHGEVVRVEEDVLVRADGSEMPVAYTAAPFVIRDGRGVRGGVRGHQRAPGPGAQIESDLEKLTPIKRIRNALDQGLPALLAADHRAGQRRERPARAAHPDAPSRGGPGALARVLPPGRRGVRLHRRDRPLGDRSLGRAGGPRPTRRVEHLGGLDRRPDEITETALVSDEAVGRRFVTALRELGCKVALDDFGTGYGGFTYLKQLPIDYLKVDIEFVRDLRQSGASRKVVEAIVNLARGFDLETVAECVEDEESLVLLRELGVDYAQGYHIGRPAELSLGDEDAATPTSTQ